MRSIILLSILSNIFLLSACKNESKKPDVELVDIFGFWEGTYIIDDHPEVEPQYLNFLIKKDGTLTSEGNYLSSVRINIGTWELEGNNFKYQVSNVYGGQMPNPQVGSAKFDPLGTLEGNIINLSGSNSGTFEMIKRQ